MLETVVLRMCHIFGGPGIFFLGFFDKKKLKEQHLFKKII